MSAHSEVSILSAHSDVGILSAHSDVGILSAHSEVGILSAHSHVEHQHSVINSSNICINTVTCWCILIWINR